MYVTSDPMLEHSRDLRVNSYQHRDCEPGYRVGEGVTTAVRPYCLTVRNIPPGLTRAGLANIFSQFGNLLECQLGGERGKVAFSSQVQAATAMAQLDRREPYRMLVDWQVDKEVREKKKIIEEEEKQFAELINEEFDQVVANNVKWNDELVKETVDVGANHFKEERELKTDLALSSKLNLSTSSSPHYQYNQPLTLPPPSTAGLCSRCSGPGLLLCSACSAWYCSQLCQADHWPRHRPHCGQPPQLERVVVKEKSGNMESEDKEGHCCKRTIEVEAELDEVSGFVGNQRMFEEVVVSYLQSPTLLYIQVVQSFPLLSSTMIDLQSSHDHQTTSPPPTLEQDSTLYLAHCEGVWYRVQVVSTSPSKNMARVFLVDYGNTDIVRVDRIKILNDHKDVPVMARKVQLVTSEEGEEWKVEELVMLREVVGEGDGVKLRIFEGNEGDIVSLEDDQGRNVLDVWRNRINLAGNNCPVFSGPARHDQLVSSPSLKNTDSEITEDNISADEQRNGREQAEKPGLKPINADVQLSSSSQADKKKATLTPPAVSLVLDQLPSSTQGDELTDNQTLPAVSSIIDQLSSTSQAEEETELQTPAVKSVLFQLSPSCKVNLLKMSAESWNSFRSLCVKEVAEDEDADWVLGGLQVEGSSSVGLDGEVGVGELVVAWDKEDQMFYRVVVVRKQHTDKGLNYGTLSIDFGKEEIYSSADLRRCWEGVSGWPALGIKVESQGNLSKEVIAELDLISKEGLTMEVTTCSNKEVVMAREIKGEIFWWTAKSVVPEKETCPPTNFLIPPPPLHPVSSPLPLNPGLHTVFLLSADSPASLSICSMSQYSMLITTMLPTIQSLATTSYPVSVPVQDSLVLVSYGDMWHRAKLVMVSNNHILARLIDLGHSISVTQDQLRHMTQPTVRSWPAVAVPCVMAEWVGMARDREMLDTMRNIWGTDMGKLVSQFQQVEVRVLSVDDAGLHVVHVPAWEGIVKRGGGLQL